MSNPCVPEPSVATGRTYFANGQWVVPEEQRPKDWRSIPVGVSIPAEPTKPKIAHSQARPTSISSFPRHPAQEKPKPTAKRERKPDTNAKPKRKYYSAATDLPGQRTCSECGIPKKLNSTNFPRRLTTASGFDGRCRECERKRSRARAEAAREAKRKKAAV